ncbi:Uncharacterised protein [Sporosarcina pasteurii]|uniref:Uncharacterized protein n=1 Tax=Sporosarcina pasteurii TaxID=1474 RepID=A0A380BBU7_SPOPA|nr:Uncharacterised protein [Sporosarcina pasteurii]
MVGQAFVELVEELKDKMPIKEICIHMESLDQLIIVGKKRVEKKIVRQSVMKRLESYARNINSDMDTEKSLH